MTGADDFAGASFPSTRWSHVLDAARGSRGASRSALEDLCRRYWRPVAAYVRARWAKSDEDALDATQAFFLSLLEREVLQRADPGRGRFRGFVKTAVANFVLDLEREKRAIKRGGDRALLAIVGEDGASLEIPDPQGRSPEEILDATWRSELVEQATAALERELAASGKELTFAVFRDYFLSTDELDYEAVAARHGITPVDVSNFLAGAKKRYRVQLRRSVLETVQRDEDLRAELSWLFEGDTA